MIPLQPPPPPTAASPAMEPSLDTVASRLILPMVSSQLQQHLPGQHKMDGLSNLVMLATEFYRLKSKIVMLRDCSKTCRLYITDVGICYINTDTYENPFTRNPLNAKSILTHLSVLKTADATVDHIMLSCLLSLCCMPLSCGFRHFQNRMSWSVVHSLCISVVTELAASSRPATTRVPTPSNLHRAHTPSSPSKAATASRRLTASTEATSSSRRRPHSSRPHPPMPHLLAPTASHLPASMASREEQEEVMASRLSTNHHQANTVSRGSVLAKLMAVFYHFWQYFL